MHVSWWGTARKRISAWTASLEIIRDYCILKHHELHQHHSAPSAWTAWVQQKSRRMLPGWRRMLVTSICCLGRLTEAVWWLLHAHQLKSNDVSCPFVLMCCIVPKRNLQVVLNVLRLRNHPTWLETMQYVLLDRQQVTGQWSSEKVPGLLARNSHPATDHGRPMDPLWLQINETKTGSIAKHD